MDRPNKMLVSAPSVDLETVAEFPEDQPEEFANQVLSQMTRSYQQRSLASAAAAASPFAGISAASSSYGSSSSSASQASITRLSDEAIGTAVCSGVLTLVTVNGVPENKRLLVSVFKTTTELFMALYSLRCPGKTVACLNLKNFSVSRLSDDSFVLQEKGADAMLAFVFRCGAAPPPPPSSSSSLTSPTSAGGVGGKDDGAVSVSAAPDDVVRWIRAASYVSPAPRRASLCQVSLPSVDEEAPELFLGFGGRPSACPGVAAAADGDGEDDGNENDDRGATGTPTAGN